MRIFRGVVLTALFLTLGLAEFGTAKAQKVFVDFDFEINSPTPEVFYNRLGSSLNSSDPVALLDENQSPSGLTFDYNKPTSSIGFQNQSILSIFEPSGLDLEPFGSNLSSIQAPGHELLISGLTPGQQYDFWMMTWAYPESFLEPMDFSITGAGDWTTLSTPENSFLVINGELGAVNRSFDSYAQRFTAEPDGNLSFTSTVGEFTGVFGFLIEPIGPPPASGSLEITPSVDGFAEIYNGSSLNQTNNTMVVQTADFIPLDRRMLMEFDLDALPEDALVQSATLDLDVRGFTSSDPEFPTLELYAYSADGSLTFDEAFAEVPFVGVSDEVQSLDPIQITLDVDQINDLVAEGATHLGLIGRSGPTGKQLSVTTIEGAELFGFAPKLTLDWVLTTLLPGDHNGDGFVSQADLDLVLLSWGEAVPPAGWSDAESFDGIMSQNELDLVLLNWGDGVPASFNAIPEPGTMVLGIGLGIGLCVRRRLRL